MDSATYDALARLAQPWVHSYPLLDFHGNVGSQFGDGPASMRYTEAKLSPLAEDGYLATLDKDTVDWGMNYTNDEKEPESLPAVFPGLFCLSNQGMGYGCACFFLPFNLVEVGEQLLNRLDGKPIGPIQFDLPTGGTITNPQDMDKILRTGKGTVVVEAAYSVSQNEIAFTELPYGVMFDDVVEQIKSLSDRGELQGVSGVVNDSGRDGIKLKIKLSKSADADAVLEFLLAKTGLRSKYSINQVALVDGQPKLLSFADMAGEYIKHNLSCIKREAGHDLAAAEVRIHILTALSQAIADIENVIAIIRNSKDRKEAASSLSEKYGWSDEQVKAILDMRLSKLSNLEGVEVEKELSEKQKLAAKFQKILDSQVEQKKLLSSRLKAIMKKYGKPRKTRVEQKEPSKMSAPVSLQRYKIAVSRGDKVMKTKASDGRLGSEMLVCLSDRGDVYRVAIDDIPGTTGNGVGYDLSLALGEHIVAVDPEVAFIVTAKGKVKRIAICDEFNGNTRNKGGMSAIKLADGDSVVGIYVPQPGTCDFSGLFMQLETSDLVKIKFPLSSVPVQKKSGSGVKGISMDSCDEVVRTTVSEDGTGSQNRGGKGKRS